MKPINAAQTIAIAQQFGTPVWTYDAALIRERIGQLKMFDTITTLLPTLPDHAVLTKAQTAVAVTLSTDTLDRLHARGSGPKRVQLSARRCGYTVGAVREWLNKRSS